MFQVVARYSEHIFFLLTSPKRDLVEFEKAIFQGLPFQFELIFGLLIIAKWELVEVENSMFQGSFNLFSVSGPA